MQIADDFCLNKTLEDNFLKKFFLKIKISKTAGIDRLSRRFSQYGAEVLSRPISETRGVFPDACEAVKLKPIYKKWKNTNPPNCRPISLLPIIFKVTEKIP